MATTLPPPSKRQRTAAAELSKTQQDVDTIPDNLGSIRVQFLDQATGQSAGPPVSIPVRDATVKNLELLLNTLQRNVGVPRTRSCFPHTSQRHKQMLTCYRMRLNGYLIASRIARTHLIPRNSTTPLTFQMISTTPFSSLA